MEDLTNDSEFVFVKESILSKSIPTPKLLIKDHKKKDDNDEFIRQLVIPATNFTAAFPKLGYIWVFGEFWNQRQVHCGVIQCNRHVSLNLVFDGEAGDAVLVQGSA
mmetsp:Transcript_21389/g.42838  ORF Transcript_21389/g.42838 Transcript_21389/m.42838 type:complete len:106 (+) Transcript_21389:364-681(+)